jgi:hypothetical protein
MCGLDDGVGKLTAAGHMHIRRRAAQCLRILSARGAEKRRAVDAGAAFGIHPQENFAEEAIH